MKSISGFALGAILLAVSAAISAAEPAEPAPKKINPEAVKPAVPSATAAERNRESPSNGVSWRYDTPSATVPHTGIVWISLPQAWPQATATERPYLIYSRFPTVEKKGPQK